jgi:hypothetical protein
MNAREELEALRRLAELEAKARGSAAPAEKPESQLKSALRTARSVLGPTIEAVPAALGGIAGTALGPVGTLAGAGLGYGAGRQLTRLMDVALGNEPAPTATQAMLGGAKDVLEGATMEAGGQVIGRGVQAGLQKLSQVPQERAARILSQALGKNVEEARQALRAQPNLPAGQALADINAPEVQALAARTAARDPAFMNALTLTQKMADMNALAQLAGGANQTAARATQDQAIANLNQLAGPARESILRAANVGQDILRFREQAEQAGAQAAQSVQDVRRFTEAGQRAREAHIFRPPGQPRVPTRYTYTGELGERAEEVAGAAAQRSLGEGATRRSLEAAAGALEKAGFRPLTTESILSGIQKAKSTPSFTGNKDIPIILDRVAADINEVSVKGVIDAERLAAIRNNSVNAAIRDLYPAADSKAHKELAVKAATEIKPLIDSAIESAGGKGWKEYLNTYAKGRQAVEQKELAAKAMELYEKNPKELIRLVRGNSLDEVEKIFGPGSYDIVKQMGDSAMGVLKQAAGTLERTAKMEAQAASGQDALRLVLDQNRSRIRVPWGLSAKGAAINQALAKAEDRIGEKTMRILTEAMKSGQRADDLLATLNPAERARVVKILSESHRGGAEFIPKGAKGAAINALLGGNQPESQNALAE